MTDWRFLCNRYIHRVRLDCGYRWDYPKYGMLLGHDEPFLKAVILKDGDTFVDVGANVGAWTIRANRWYRQIYAYEPNTVFFRSLQRNIDLNHCINIHPFNLALDNNEGITDQNILPPITADRPMRTFPAKTRTLDSQKLEALTTLKIDAEGAAKRIILGGLQTILEYHPLIIVEVHSQEEATVPELLPAYQWQKQFRMMPQTGDWLYRENNQQVFLIGRP